MRGYLNMLLAGAGALAIGCSSDPAPTSQLDFNLTVAADREQWKPEGLAYQGSVGPYAVYTVTAAQQRLVGPRVLLPSQSGVAVLASAQNYFVPNGQGSGAELALECAGKQVVSNPQGPTKDGSCTGPSQSAGSAPTAGSDGGAPPPSASADAGAGWGSGCTGSTSGSSGSSGGSSGGWGSGSGGYGGSTGGSGGYGGSTGGSGGWGGSSGGSSGGSYSNPGGWNNGGWNNSGCDGGASGGTMNGGTPPGGQNPPGGSNTGGSTSGGSNGGSTTGGSNMPGGGSAGTPGSGADSNGGADVAVNFQHPAPVGSTVLIRSITIHSTQTTRGADTAPGICCSGGMCSLSSSGHIQ